MVSEAILGRITDPQFAGCQVDYVDIEWHETFKKLHKKVTHSGQQIGIRLGDDVLRNGLNAGDVLYREGNDIVAVHIPPCEVIVVEVDRGHARMAAKVCYEIGNRHAPLFWGDHDFQFLTPYNAPMLSLLSKLHGVETRVETRSFDLSRKISAVVHNHTH